jgi:excisionase family DNA binding protein
MTRTLGAFDVYSRLVSTLHQRLKQAIEAHRKALEELENALLEFEDTLDDQMKESSKSQGVELLSIPEVCRILGMGKSWTYRRIKSGEIPSVKLGRSIKVRRVDLEGYLESSRYNPPDEG